jgi:hypothetical protein
LMKTNIVAYRSIFPSHRWDTSTSTSAFDIGTCERGTGAEGGWPLRGASSWQLHRPTPCPSWRSVWRHCVSTPTHRVRLESQSAIMQRSRTLAFRADGRTNACALWTRPETSGFLCAPERAVAYLLYLARFALVCLNQAKCHHVSLCIDCNVDRRACVAHSLYNVLLVVYTINQQKQLREAAVLFDCYCCYWSCFCCYVAAGKATLSIKLRPGLSCNSAH